MSVLRDVFTDNLVIKVAAILLALLVYFHVRTERQEELTFRVPVELEGLPDSLTWTGQIPQEVSVGMSGKLKDLLKLRISPVRISVNVADAGPGRFQRSLSAADVPVGEDSGVMVTHVPDPVRIDILIERKLTKTVPVFPVIEGEALPGVFLAKAPLSTPESTTVTGPESVVSGIDSVYTEPIDISRRREPFSLTVRLDPRGRTFTTSVSSVDVFVELEAETMGTGPVPPDAE